MANRLSARSLERIISALKTERRPAIGEVWKHTKTNTKYRVIGFALEPTAGTTPIPKVIYANDCPGKYAPNVFWVRNTDDFRAKFTRDTAPEILCDF